MDTIGDMQEVSTALFIKSFFGGSIESSMDKNFSGMNWDELGIFNSGASCVAKQY